MKQGREGNPWQVAKPVMALVVPEGNRLRLAVGLQEPLPNREARQQGYLSANCLSFICVLVGILIFRHFWLALREDPPGVRRKASGREGRSSQQAALRVRGES